MSPMGRGSAGGARGIVRVGGKAASLSGKHQAGRSWQHGLGSEPEPGSPALVQRPRYVLFRTKNLGRGALLGLHRPGTQEVPGWRGGGPRRGYSLRLPMICLWPPAAPNLESKISTLPPSLPTAVARGQPVKARPAQQPSPALANYCDVSFPGPLLWGSSRPPPHPFPQTLTWSLLFFPHIFRSFKSFWGPNHVH